MDDGGRSGVQEQQPLQDLPAPAAQHLRLHHLEPLQVPAGAQLTSYSCGEGFPTAGGHVLITQTETLIREECWPHTN